MGDDPSGADLDRDLNTGADGVLKPTPVGDQIAFYDDANAPMRAMLALEAGRMGSWSWDIRAGTVVGDPFVAQLLNLDPDAQPWPLDNVFASMHPDDLTHVQAAVADALDGADIYEVEFRDRILDPKTGEEGLRWLGARGRVTDRSPDGAPLRMIGVNWDATPQKQQEENLAVLAAEMDHRVKNAFAVMRAMINIGQTTDATKDSFAETLKAQVDAMATAHTLSAKMARASQQARSSVELGQVLETALGPWMQGRGPKQVQLACNNTIALTPTRVSSLSMLIYELVTNAVKYGALSTAAGTLSVVVEQTGQGSVSIAWHEKSPSITALPPDGFSGFGSLLIDHCVHTLKADLTRNCTTGHLQINLVLDTPPTPPL